jgi:hypothetical protein
MAADVGDAGERQAGIGCTASPPGCSQPPGIKPRILSGDRRLGLVLLALLDHPVDHPDDPTGPFWTRLDPSGPTGHPT